MAYVACPKFCYKLTNQLTFAIIGYSLGGAFLSFWQLNGGLSVFGYPISEPKVAKNSSGDTVLTQWFERARLGWHADTNLVLGGLLGRWSLPVSPDQPALQRVGPSGNKDLLFFSETGHSLGGGFKDFWLKRGGLAVFGFPLSEEFKEINHKDYLFYELPKIKLDDEIIISTGPQDRYYKMIEILTLKPEDTRVMGPSDSELLTLITCVPYEIYSDRLIVRAVPLKAI